MNKQDWTYKKLGEVANVTDYVANGSFATLRENVHYLDTDGYAILVRLADYTNNFDSSRFVYIDEHAYNFLSKSKLYGGEIIMSNVGSIGKSFICPKLSKPMSLAPNSIVINTSNNRFYFYYFNSTSFQSSLKTISSKTALPKFNKTQFKGLCAPVPPIGEQERIVAELDLLSGIIEKKKEQLKAYDQLAQSIFYTMFGDPIDNPKGWETKKLGEVCKTTSGGTPSKNHTEYYDGGTIPWLRSGEVSQGFIYNTELFITEEGLKCSSAKMIPIDTVVIAMYGATVGQVGIIKSPMCTNQAICSILPNDIFIPIYLYYFLLSKKSDYLKVAVGGAQPNISQGIIKETVIGIPPLSLQQEFAEKVEAIERQKALVQQSIDETQTMFDCTMDKYFG